MLIFNFLGNVVTNYGKLNPDNYVIIDGMQSIGPLVIKCCYGDSNHFTKPGFKILKTLTSYLYISAKFNFEKWAIFWEFLNYFSILKKRIWKWFLTSLPRHVFTVLILFHTHINARIEKNYIFERSGLPILFDYNNLTP